MIITRCFTLDEPNLGLNMIKLLGFLRSLGAFFVCSIGLGLELWSLEHILAYFFKVPVIFY